MTHSPPVDRTLPGPVSILMPVCNEAEVIEQVIEEWANDVFRHLPPESELLFDEAASTDGTREILERLRQKYPYIRVMYNERKDGFAAAARRLYREAKCPFVFFTDSDGQYVPSEFWKLAPHAKRFPFVHGAKIGRQDPLYRRIASFVFNNIARVIFDTTYSDINSAFRLIERDTAVDLMGQCKHMPTLLNAEILLRAEFQGVPVKQVRVLHRARKSGVSKGLPPGSFFSECIKAYRGLFNLRDEYLK